MDLEMLAAVAGVALTAVFALPKVARTFEEEWRFAGRIVRWIGALYPFAFGYAAGAYVITFANHLAAYGAAIAGAITVFWFAGHGMHYIDRHNDHRDPGDHPGNSL